MASSTKPFSASGLEKRLRDLSSTMQSIQSLSHWLLQYRRHAKTIVSVWFKELQKASASRKLTLIYVANDIIQNGKHKGPEFKGEFSKALPKAFQLVSREKGDESVRKSIGRVLSVWQERKVFDQDMLKKLKNILATGSAHLRRSKSESDSKRNPSLNTDSSLVDRHMIPSEAPPNNREPPQAEELLKRMMATDGNNSAAQDMATRAKIANFPPEVFDPQILSKATDKTAVSRLLVELDGAVEVLTDYNTRLEKELEERGELQELLDVFIWQQQRLLRHAIEKQKEYQSKLEQGTAVREELKSHIASLPDLSSLPLTGPSSAGLAPLPSVGDLFS